MGVNVPASANVLPLRVHGKCAWIDYTLDECPKQIHIILAFTCNDEKNRNAFIILCPGNCGEEWDGILEFALDDKKPDEIVIHMDEHNLGHLITAAWSPKLRVVPYE